MPKEEEEEEEIEEEDVEEEEEEDIFISCDGIKTKRINYTRAVTYFRFYFGGCTDDTFSSKHILIV